jgi:transcriptional regulator with XRE-family HTH domain
MTIPIAPAPDDLNETVLANLRSIMGRRNLRRGHVSELTGKNPSWVGRRLTGRYSMTIADLEVFANALEVSPAALIEGRAE